MKNIPDKIYLSLGDECPYNADFRNLSEVTWSEDKVSDNDVEYVRKSEWISVRERLPEEMQRVLVWIGDEALVCWYTKSGRFKTTLRSQERYSEDIFSGLKIHLSPCREDVTDVVTHWMSIPIPQFNPEKRRKMKIEISQDKDGLYFVETTSQIASRLMWHEMIALIGRITEPKESPECLVWLKNKDLFTNENP